MNRNRKGYVMGTSLHSANSKGNKSAFKHGDGTWGGSKTNPKGENISSYIFGGKNKKTDKR